MSISNPNGSSTCAVAADEICSSCGLQVTLSGNFEHRKNRPSLEIQGAPDDPAAFREEITGTNFTVSISHLPAGQYSLVLGEAETLATGPGERLFDVSSGDVVLAANFDIFATAGGSQKFCRLTGVLEHEDDSIKGPLTVSFAAAKGTAKFNTFELKDASGASVIRFTASEMADPFSAAAAKPPEIREAPIWGDPARPLSAREADLIRRLSLAEKVAQLQNAAPAIPRIGLPAYDYWNEALHGVANNGVATVFPEPIGGAAAWNPELLHQEGTVIGIEGRAKFNYYASQHGGNSKWWNGLTFWTPNVNIFRDPRWGRGQETYGEDPYLTGAMAVEFVRGIQGDDPNVMMAMACAKHYAVHSGPEAERHRFDARPSERDLYETYLPQFERTVREGHVGGVMGAYNSLNGVPCCASPFLLDELLRKRWGFEGYVVSDCDAIRNIWAPEDHHYVATPELAAAAAVKAGCDLCCGRDYAALVRAVQQGLISEKEIDQALAHTLWTRFKLGLFDPPEKCPYSRITLDQNDTPEHRRLALQLARESLVLLKNDGILPLDRSRIKRIAVFGETAKSSHTLWGNYNGTASRTVTILNGIRELAGTNIAVTYAQGCPITTDPIHLFPWEARESTGPARPVSELREEALRSAGQADVLIYVGGISPLLEGEQRDRTRIELPPVQEEFIHALAGTGKPLILVNCSGSAMALSWEAEHLPAILQAWYPGEEGGRAVGEILFGEVNPSGHLPVTFYRATEDLPSFTDYSMSNRTYRYFTGKPLFAFGHGLSYTRFEFNDGRLESKTIAPGQNLKVSFTLKNAGERDGDEVVQVYFRHLNSAVPQPQLALCGFLRVPLKHSESNRVNLQIPAERFRYWNTDAKQYVVEPGDYELLVGAASDDIRLKLPARIVTR